jgi:hypothetical protein
MVSYHETILQKEQVNLLQNFFVGLAPGVIVPRNPFQPVLILAGKARSLPKSGTPEQCPIQTGPALFVNIWRAGKGLNVLSLHR